MYILAPHILLDLVLWRVGISCMTKYNCSPFFPSCSFIHMRCSRTYHYISLYFLCVALYTNGVWPTLETISLDESGKQRSDTYRLKGETNRHYTKKRSRLASTSLDPTTGFGCICTVLCLLRILVALMSVHLSMSWKKHPFFTSCPRALPKPHMESRTLANRRCVVIQVRACVYS